MYGEVGDIRSLRDGKCASLAVEGMGHGNSSMSSLTRAEEKAREASMTASAKVDRSQIKAKRPPLKKSISVLMKGKFNAFCEAGTIHGLGNIRRSEHWFTKLAWGAVILMQTGFLVYIFATYLDTYFNYYVQKGSTELSWEEETVMELPDITICASSPFKRSAIGSMQGLRDDIDQDLHVNSTFMAYLLMGFGAGAYIRQDYYTKAVHHHGPMREWLDQVLKASNVTYKELVMSMALRCEDIVLQCAYDGRELDQEECCRTIFPEPAITSNGPCLSSHGNPQMQRIFGKKGGLTFVMKTDDYSEEGLDNNLLTDAGDIYGYTVTITNPVMVPSTLTTTTNKGAPAGMKTSMELSKTVEDWSGLVLPQFRGKPKVCVALKEDASVMNYSEIMKEYAEWRGNCLLTKLFELSEDNCGCRLIDDPRINDSLVICKPDDILRCSLPSVYQDPTQLPSMFEMVKVTGNDASSFSEHCLPLCRETKFKTTMSYELLSAKFMADMRIKHKLQGNDEIAIVKIFFTDTNFNTIVHKAYTLLDCFGTIGGYMGMLLGASMISVVETGYFLFKFLFEFMCLYLRKFPACHDMIQKHAQNLP